MIASRFAVPTLVLLVTASSFAFAQTEWVLDTVVTVGTNPTGIAITSDGSKLVVTNNTSPGSVAVVSTSDYAVSTIDISSIENNPNGATVAPGDSTALVCTTHNVVFIDLKKNSVKAHITAPCAGTTLYGIAVVPSGLNAVLPDLSSGCTQQGIRLIDATGSTSGSSFIPVSTSGELYGIAITPDGGSAVVTTFTSDSPKKVNLATSAVQSIAGIFGSYVLPSPGRSTSHCSIRSRYFRRTIPSQGFA